MITSSTVNPRTIINRSSTNTATAAMAGSVDDLGGVGPAPPDSWEVADLDATMSRLMLSSKRDNNSDSTTTTSSSPPPPPSDFASASPTPIRSSSGGVLENLVNSVDQFLREALQNPRERLSVLRMEQDVEKFIRDPLQQQMEFQQLPTSYLRLAAHRVAQHYSLQSMVLLDNNLPDGSGSRIIVRKTSDCRLPPIRLADIPVTIPTEDPPANPVKVAIKQRPNKRSQNSGGSNSNSAKNNSLKSVEERKEEYNRARARIFSSSSGSEPSRVQEVFQHIKIEEVSVPGGADVALGRSSSVDMSAGSSRPGRSRSEKEKEPVVRSRSNSRVAIFRDREVERKDPDYDRNYDRYAQTELNSPKSMYQNSAGDHHPTMASEGSFTIPPEIITDILYRLPAKSLGRFRCVSKDWLSLISEPQFIKIHQNTHNRSHLIFVSNHHPLYSLPIHHHEAESPQEPTKIRFETDNTSIALHGSCNGLVLLITHHDFTSFQLVVLNPTTGEFLKSQNPVMKLRTDFLEIEIMYGLGYDSVTDDYKVVIVSYFHNHGIIPPDNMSVHVHSLRTKTWRRVTDSPYDHSYGMSLPGVFVNGFLHWIAKKSSDHLPVIVAFNLADENFSELPSPNFKIDCKLVALNGKLAVFMEDEVWLMNEYGVRESWTKILVLGILPKIEPMSFNYNGKVLFVNHDQIYIYDIEERSFCKSGNVSRSLKDLKVKGSYIESLMSPNYR